MIGIKSIVYEQNGNKLIINISNESIILYENDKKIIKNEKLFPYLELLISIIKDWQTQYIDSKVINSDTWSLSIIDVENKKKEFCGKSKHPVNFEAFERWLQKLRNEVQNG